MDVCMLQKSFCRSSMKKNSPAESIKTMSTEKEYQSILHYLTIESKVTKNRIVRH